MLKVIPMEDVALKGAEHASSASPAVQGISRDEIARVVEAVDANVSLNHVGLGNDDPLDASALPVVARPVVQSLRLSSPLSLVATANYLRYGPRGVPRYGPASSEISTSRPSADLLSVKLTLADPMGEVLLDVPNVILHRSWTGPEQVLWEGYLPQYGLHVMWVWDFYRILSFLGLNTQLGQAFTTEQESLQTVLEQLASGDSIEIAATLPTGDIAQHYKISDKILAGRDFRHAEQG